MLTAGLFVGTVGAILWLAVEAPSPRGIDIPTLGFILLLAGVLLVCLDTWLALVRRPRRTAPGPQWDVRTGPPVDDTDHLRVPRRAVWDETGYLPTTPARPAEDHTRVLPVHDARVAPADPDATQQIRREPQWSDDEVTRRIRRDR